MPNIKQQFSETRGGEHLILSVPALTELSLASHFDGAPEESGSRGHVNGGGSCGHAPQGQNSIKGSGKQKASDFHRGKQGRGDESLPLKRSETAVLSAKDYRQIRVGVGAGVTAQTRQLEHFRVPTAHVEVKNDEFG